MKWIYGKQDWKTLERGLENCYLLTNGLGGFSSLTMTGGASRNDHALLMACTKAPNCRYNLVHRLKEELLTENEENKTLSTQEFKEKELEQGCLYLTSFTYEDTPVWKFLIDGVEVRKEIGMLQKKNTVAVHYDIHNRSRKKVTFAVTPFYQFVPKGDDLEKIQKISCENISGNTRIQSNGISLFFRTDGKNESIKEIEESYFYRYDICDGRRAYGCARAYHKITIEAEAGQHIGLDLVYEMELSQIRAEEVILETKQYRKALEEKAGLTSEIGKMLVKSANQFISKRESTGGKTILAGYPFFEDWGRDTMIALPGLCISTGQYEATKDRAFVREMYPVMERIINGYQRGTLFGIYMDRDGLICAGEGLAQVTWMDVRVGDILPTPRHGKPVEINAYWYNALRIMALFAEEKQEAERYTKQAEQASRSFAEKFWMPEKSCLKDVISGTYADEQIRCNQIWAVSMPFSILDGEKERQIVETVFEKLYTSYGLRTLEEADEQFHPVYEGGMKDRDMAYHQGTVWTFPLGAYYLAYLKVYNYSETAKQTVTE